MSKRGLFGEFCSLEQSSAMSCQANVGQQLSDMDAAELVTGKCAKSTVTDLAKKHNGTPDRHEKEHGIVGHKDRIYGSSTKCVLGF